MMWKSLQQFVCQYYGTDGAYLTRIEPKPEIIIKKRDYITDLRQKCGGINEYGFGDI